MLPRRETRLAVVLAGLLPVALAGPGCKAFIYALLPGEPPVPPSHWSSVILPRTDAEDRDAFNDRSPEAWEAHYREKDREARELSAKLEAYVRGWLAGKNPAKLPPGLLPPSIENEKTRNWTLCRPDEVRPEEQWGIRPAGEIPADFSRLYFLSPDNHCTYGKLFFLAPFGAELVLEGEFPHCRFFDLQITPPFDPRMPCPLVLGAPEVPIVDVDIDPRSGHVNPFRVGARRNAEKRSYRVTFGLAAGNAVALNPEAMVPPAYRAPGNRRVGGPFSYTGSLGLGTILAGVVWLRYYAPDRTTGPLAGVALPKAHLKLSTGETFWIRCDFSLASRRQNTAVAGFETEPADPPASMGAEHGWWKMFSIWLVTAEGIGYVASRSWLLTTAFVKRLIREADHEHFRRGADMEPPGNYECSATCCNYINYLVRPIPLGEGKVIVITGRLPKTPKTRNGEPRTEASECRYWSIARTADSPDKTYPKILYGCLMDDEILLDEERRYVIAYSRKEERPANATVEAGVTWQDWGPTSFQVMNIRWLSVMPHDHLPAHAPDEGNIPWAVGAWSQESYDETLVGRNNEPGLLGPYHPRIHYLTREAFEALGSPVKAATIPSWR